MTATRRRGAGPPRDRDRGDGRVADRRAPRGRMPTGSSSRPPAAGNTAASLLAAAERAMADGLPVVARRPAARRAPRGPATRSPAAARRGCGPGRCSPATCRVRRRGSRSRSVSAPGWTATGCGAARRPGRSHDRGTAGGALMPLDALVTAAGSRRSPAIAGSAGSRRSGSADGRVAFAGSAVELETRADPHTVGSSWTRTRSRSPA